MLTKNNFYLVTVCGSAAWYSEKSIDVNGAPFYMFDELAINIYVNANPLMMFYAEILNTTTEAITVANKHFSLESKFIHKVSINDAHTHGLKWKESKLNINVLAVCDVGLKIWKQTYCERILLYKSRFEIGNGSISHHLYIQLKNKYLHFNENKVAVCLDDYIQAARSARTTIHSGTKTISKVSQIYQLVLMINISQML